MKLILGSQSKGRQEVLINAGYQFEVMTSNIDEKAIRADDYERLPLLLARAKAEAILPHITEPSLLITSDQVVVCQGELREKPTSIDQARSFLESYSQYPAQTNTAVVVTNTQSRLQAEAIDIAKVFFKPIPIEVIQQIIEKGDVMRAAGGFIIQDPLLKPYIDHIEGTVESIIGLPLEQLEMLIKQVNPV